MRRARLDMIDVSWFQSAPGMSAGRCIRVGNHAPVVHGFQSAPGMSAGRCAACSSLPLRAWLFQSAPGMSAGRCADHGMVHLHSEEVSIRARHECRAMLGWLA